MDEHTAEILDECLNDIAAGASIESCLARYPELRDELEPALRAAARLQALPQQILPAASRVALEQRMLDIAAKRRVAPPPRSPMRPGMVGVLVAVVIAGLALAIAIGWMFKRPQQPSQLPSSTALPAATSLATAAPAFNIMPAATNMPQATALPMATGMPQATQLPTAIPPTEPLPSITNQQHEEAPSTPASSNQDEASTPRDTSDPQHQCQGWQNGRDEKTCAPHPTTTSNNGQGNGNNGGKDNGKGGGNDDGKGGGNKGGGGKGGGKK